MNPFFRDKIENWVADFCADDVFAGFKSETRETAPPLLVHFLMAACQARDVDPAELEERDLRVGLDALGRYACSESVRRDFPSLAAALFESLQRAGRMGHAEELGLFMRAASLPLGKRQPEKRPSDKLRRNDPCFCGSGLKYKQCCLKALG